MPILVGTDGRRKMSKSLGNHIAITDPPRGDLRQDDVACPMRRWTSTSGCCSGESREPRPRADGGKRALARGLVSMLYSPEQASAAEAHFDRVVVDQQEPEEIPEASVGASDGLVHLPGVIAEEFGLSRSEARRLIDQGAVTLGAEPLGAGEHDVAAERADGPGSEGRKATFPPSSRRLDPAALDRAILPGRPAGAPGRGSDRSPPEGTPFGEARRSLKTQQHAHLRSIFGSRCASRFDPPTGALRAPPEAVKSQVDRSTPSWFGTTVYRFRPPAQFGRFVFRVVTGNSMTAFREVLHGEFDPGSGRTLAACLTHASGATNQGLPWGRAANG